MIESNMPRKPHRLKVGDRVRFILGTREVVAHVVEDRGPIGVGGRQLVAVSMRTPEGELERFEVAAEEVTLDRKRRPA